MSIDKLLDKVLNFGIDIFVCIIILIAGLKFIKILEKALKKENKFEKFDASVKSFIVSIISISLKVLLIVIIATIIGIPTTSLITLIGSCGIAVGLALQGGLSNLAGGVMIVIFKPFKVGDYIECNSKEGKVKAITIFYTTLISADNKSIQIPNSEITSNSIVNYNVNNKRRVDLEFSVSYSCKIEKVKKIINEVIDNSQYIIKDENRIIGLKKHDSSSLIFDVKVYCKASDYFNCMYELNESIKNAFDKNKIEIPFNQLDVHLKNK